MIHRHPLIRAMIGSAPAWAMLLLIGLTCAPATLAEDAAAPRFAGWQGMRVIEQQGFAIRMTAADLNGNGKQELLVVNPRQARIDIYHHAPNKQEPAPRAATARDRVNELPMAPDFERVELGLDNLPIDVLAHDLDGDGKAELIVLVNMPNRVEVHRLAADAGDSLTFEKARTIDLLEGDFAGRGSIMLMDTAGDVPTLLVSMAQGIQSVAVTIDDPAANGGAATRATWLEPKQAIARADWWLADLDGDGQPDLIEWTTDAQRSLRWMRRVDGRFMPPQTLHDRLVNQAVVFRSASGAAEIAMLGGVQAGVLRRYRLGFDEQAPVGGRQTLALEGTDKTPWCVVSVDDQPTLIAVDSAQPRLNTFALDEHGWKAGQTYPLITGVEQIVAVHAKPGTVLLRVRESGRLYTSRWDGERFLYPTALHLDALDTAENQSAERAVLNLGSVGHTTWWTQRIGNDVVLCRYQPGSAEPSITRFDGLGDKVREAVWLSGDRLLVNDQYARQPRLVALVDGEVKSEEPAHLRTIKADQLQLFEIDGRIVLGRLTEGVLQWLDEAMQPTDQVMLPEGARLIGFAPIAESDGHAWALQAGGRLIHKLIPDEADILRVNQSHRLPGGVRLLDDPVAGLLLIDRDSVTRLTEGRARQIELVQSIDSREGRPSGVREATIHRIIAADVLGKGHQQLLLADDQRHQLSLLDADPDAEHEGTLKSVISWPVFEDSKYPYGYTDPSMGTEPRRVIALDIDGDGKQDLAMLSHDRVILYLARETKP